MSGDPPISLVDVREAEAVLRGVANRTPVLTSRSLDALTGASVYVKAESLQRAGAFKFRGAFNRISRLPGRVRGAATYSSGNHAQAVALAASIVGLPSVVLMPKDAPRAKMEATRAYGAEVVTYDRYGEDRERLGRALARERGFELVPPYEDPLVMAGQGTAALELVEEAGALDYLVVPVGGGGLIAGSATAAKGLLPNLRVIGVEPVAGDDTRRSLAAGRRVRLQEVPRTIADGLQAQEPGALTFEVNRRLVDEVVTVDDRSIVGAMAFLFERMKTVAEPSGAVAVAALLSGGRTRGSVGNLEGRRVGVILSGGNIAADRFAQIMAGSPGKGTQSLSAEARRPKARS